MTSPYTRATKSDDRMHCTTCGITDYADELGDTVTCAWCDSPDLILEATHVARLRAERLADEAAVDEWHRLNAQPGFLRRRQAA